MEKQNRNLNDHLANERTFLAWIRTSIGIMGFGFVVVKFSLFVRQLALVLNAKPLPNSHYSPIIGIFLVGIGGALSAMAYLRYRKVQKKIEDQNFQQSNFLIKSMTALIFILCVVLIVYLIMTT